MDLNLDGNKRSLWTGPCMTADDQGLSRQACGEHWIESLLKWSWRVSQMYYIGILLAEKCIFKILFGKKMIPMSRIESNEGNKYWDITEENITEGYYYVFYRMFLKSVKIRYYDDGSIGKTSHWFLGT